jgi:hypothetical protein
MTGLTMLELDMRGLVPKSARTCLLTSCLLGLLATGGPTFVLAQDKTPSSSGAPQAAKAVGVIKSVQAGSIVVTSEAGGDIAGMLSASTKILRVPPGEKDLKNATALQAQDLQPGDRVLLRGQASGDGHTITALAVIVMKQADVSAMHQHDLEDWQKRGVGGIVTKVDAAGGVVTISSSSGGTGPGGAGPSGGGASHTTDVHIGKDTILRRYAPDSVKFDDAKPAPLDQIKTGDQLRARGARTSDGEVSADEVVTGSFRSVAGPIKAVDVANNTVTVQDVISKSPVTVKISPDSQMWKLPAEMAQRFAARLKGAAAGGSGDQAGGAAPGPGGGAHPPQETRTAGPPSADSFGAAGGRGPGPAGNGPPDLQRMLSRLPNIKLPDLQKDDTVYILTTTGGNSGTVTASKLVAGVEAILTAAPNRSASSLLSPWTLNAAGGEGENSQ